MKSLSFANSNIKFILISPDELKTPEYVKKEILEKKNIPFIEKRYINDNIDELDILYMTRIQKERFASEEEYEKIKTPYVLDLDKLKNAKKDLCIMHPLPRVNEISVKVDEDSRACYFKQAEYGKYIRMALILKLLNEKKINNEKENVEEELVNKITCKNPRCITSVEQELDQIFLLTDKENEIYRCKYCDTKGE